MIESLADACVPKAAFFERWNPARKVLAALCILTLFSYLPLRAQVLFGSMVGSVTDATGASVAGAAVKITETSTNNVFTATTNESGGYTVSNLQAGTYQVEISKEGFRTFVSSNILVNQNNVVRIDAPLQVGSQVEKVEVTAEAAALQTDRADIHSEVAAQQLLNVPQPNRNYQTMLVMVPGTTPPGGQIQGGTNNPSKSSQFSFNGQGTQAANVRIEGVSARNPWVTQYTTFVPSVEAIENVNVVTNAADAEQGLAGGASVNVRLKSGTNETHGSIFAYNVGSYSEAQNFFAPAGSKVPHLVNNSIGGSVGGHIIRNKLFYFGSYDGDYLRSAVSGLLSLPNATTLAGNFSGSPNPIYDPRTGNADGTGRTPFPGNVIPSDRVDPVVRKLLPHFPAVTYPNLTQNNTFVNQGQTYNLHKIDTKVDYTATSKLRISGRYGYQPYYNLQDPIYGQFLGGSGGFSSAGAGNYLQHGATLAVSASATYIVNPTFVLDATFGVTQGHQLLFPTNSDVRQGADLGIPGANTGPLPWAGGLPRFAITNYVSFGYSYPALEYKDPIFEYAANGTKTAGKHTLRFGADIMREHQNHIEVRETAFTFTGGVTALNARGAAAPNSFNSVADFLLGTPTTLGNYVQFTYPLTLRTTEMAFYVRDQFQASRKLTVNYGLRWEYYPVPTQENQQLTYYDPKTNIVERCGVGSVPKNCGMHTSKMLFAPSIGFAYRPFEDFVIRAGYTLSPQTDASMGRQSIQSYPDEAQSTINGATSFTPAGTVSGTGAPVIPQPTLVDGKTFAPPGTGNLFTNPLDFVRGYFQSYNFTVEKALKGDWTAQVGYVGSHAVKIVGNYNINYGLPGGGAASQPLNKYGITATANVNLPAYSDKYNSLQATLRKRYSRGVNLNLAFTYQHDIGILPSQTINVFIPQYFNRNKTTTSTDRTFNLYVGGGYELPFGKGKPFVKSGPLAWVVGGWTVNGLFSHISGSPFTVTSSGASCNCPGLSTSTGYGQTANQILPTVDLVGRGVGGTSYFNPLAYAPVTTATLGTSGYNQLRGPGATNLDLSLFRVFPITERIKLQFRAESLNLSNTPHFNNPNANVSNAQFGPNGNIINLNGFSQITQTALISRLIDPRYFRFGIRINF